MLLHMQTAHTDLITTKEAADILEESIYTTLRRVSAGELTPVTKLPGLRGAFVFDATQVTTFKSTLDQTASAKSASTDASSAEAFVVSGGEPK